MNNRSRKIQIILITVVIHLFVVVAMMFYKLGSIVKNEVSFTYIDLNFLKEIEESDTEVLPNDNLSDIDIDKYISAIRNVGVSGNQNFNLSNFSSFSEAELSEAELKTKYETELLQEKYGNNYPIQSQFGVKNNLSESSVESNNSSNISNNKDNNKSGNNNVGSSYSGPALVYVELENKNRGNSYIHVPVFTCKYNGKVVVNITISSDGGVKSATIASIKSGSSDSSCIENAAKEAALKSKFTAVSGSSTEKGKITYTFIEQ